jgi:hypothetical protein
MDMDTGRSERAQPHWVWVVAAVVIPITLVMISLLGLGRGAFVSTSVAAVLPQLAVIIALGVLAVALLHRRRTPMAIAAFGLFLTLLAFGWLHWVAQTPH